jgi:hypothetical protein
MLVNTSPKNSSRNTAEVRSSLDKSLRAYATAAGAAGVGLLALAPNAQAKIVFTAVHQTIRPDSTLKIDLNNDGVTDFTITDEYFATFAHARNTGGPFPTGGYAAVQPAPSNQVVEATSNGGIGHFAQALPGGATINGSDKFGGNNASMVYCFGTGGVVLSRRGEWLHSSNRYLALKFVINGQTHFGWARITISLPGGPVGGCIFSVMLSGYAYETVANKAIIAGETSGPGVAENLIAPVNGNERSLGVLALGAPGLAVWRREEETAAS